MSIHAAGRCARALKSSTHGAIPLGQPAARQRVEVAIFLPSGEVHLCSSMVQGFIVRAMSMSASTCGEYIAQSNWPSSHISWVA